MKLILVLLCTVNVYFNLLQFCWMACVSKYWFCQLVGGLLAESYAFDLNPSMGMSLACDASL